MPTNGKPDEADVVKRAWCAVEAKPAFKIRKEYKSKIEESSDCTSSILVCWDRILFIQNQNIHYNIATQNEVFSGRKI